MADELKVGVVGGSGIVGMKAATPGRYFISGVAYPDFLLFDADSLTKGTKAVRAAGYFGDDWSLKRGQIAWRKR